MAEYLARKLYPEIEFHSGAGGSPEPSDHTESAVITLRRYRIDGSAHVPHKPDPETLRTADVVIVFGPTAERFANDHGRTDAKQFNVTDPYRGSLQEYSECSMEIVGILAEEFGKSRAY